MYLLFFASFVIRPAIFRGGNVFRLAAFRSSTNEDYEPISVPAEINTIAGTKIDFVFENAAADTFHVRQIPLLNARQSRRHTRGGVRIELHEPVGETLIALLVNVAPNLDHRSW